MTTNDDTTKNKGGRPIIGGYPKDQKFQMRMTKPKYSLWKKAVAPCGCKSLAELIERAMDRYLDEVEPPPLE